MGMMLNDWLTTQHALIGCVIMWPDMTGQLFADTTEADFSGTPLELYLALRQMYREGQQADATILNSRTGMKYNEYLIELLTNLPVYQSQFENYLERVHTEGRRVRIRQLLEDTIEADLDEESIAACQNGLNEILAENVKGGGKTLPVLAKDFMEHLDRKPEYIPTGIRALDNAFHYRKANFNILAARPGIGKTAMALQMALYQSQHGLRVGFFSYEGNADELTERILANQSDVPWSYISDRDLNQTRLIDVQKAVEKLQKNENLMLFDASGWTAEEIGHAAIAKRLDVIYVDYLQLVPAARGTKNLSRFEIVTDTSISLRTLANRQNISVFALSQLNREGKGKPSLSELRESGQLEQDADTVAMIYDDQDVRAAKIFDVQKNRHGACVKTKLKWDGAVQRFSYMTYAEQTMPQPGLLEPASDMMPVPF